MPDPRSKPQPGEASAQAARAAIEREALALGFSAVGFAEPADVAHAASGLADFVAAGHHGTMGWMEERLHHRSNPQNLWPEAKSLIAVGLNYGPSHDPRLLDAHPDHGAVSVYARGKDYHDVLKKKLKALGRYMAQAFGCQLKVFVDTAPVLEKPIAAAAGLGWQGKHTNLVSSEFGSWLFLGVIYTDMALGPAAPHAYQCGSCTACLDACPTDAFPAPGKIDARRCISYLTIEHKGPIDESLRAQLGNRIYGCDVCLAACPWNKFAQKASEAAFYARAELGAPRLADLLTLNDAGFREMFSGSPIKRIGRNRFVRNCLYAAGNSGDQRFLKQIEVLRADPDPVVADAADWAKARLEA